MKIYTDADLIQALQRKAQELGKTPTRSVMDHDPNMPSSGVYLNRFGSWFNATTAAGLERNLFNISKEKLIKDLQNLAKTSGQVPTSQMTGKKFGIACYTTYQHVFGSWSDALEAAGLDSKKPKYNKEELIALLQQKAKKLGGIPSCVNMNIDPNMPSSQIYIRVFGSWSNAVKQANLVTVLGERNGRAIKYYTNKELIDLLQKQAHELNKTPSTLDVGCDPDMPSPMTYAKRFGSWNNAVQVAGLRPNWSGFTEEFLIEALRKKAKQLGRTPYAKDLQYDRNIPSYASYFHHFGSWANALHAAGMEPNGKRVKKIK